MQICGCQVGLLEERADSKDGKDAGKSRHEHGPGRASATRQSNPQNHCLWPRKFGLVGKNGADIDVKRRPYGGPCSEINRPFLTSALVPTGSCDGCCTFSDTSSDPDVTFSCRLDHRYPFVFQESPFCCIFGPLATGNAQHHRTPPWSARSR